MKNHFILGLLMVFSICFSANAQNSENEATARQWISNHSKELNIPSFTNFKLTFVRKSLSGENLRFQQQLNNVPVYQSEIVVHFSPKNEITYTANSLKNNLQNISISSSITKDQALSVSNIALNNNDNKQVASNNLYVMEIDNQTKLVYRIVTNPSSGAASWETIIDAQTGAIIRTKDVAIYDKPKKKTADHSQKSTAKPTKTASFVSATALVYNPDPLSKMLVAYGGQYVDGSDATNTSLDNARESVTLPEVDLTAGVYKLKSSYVQINDFESPSKGLFTQATNNFSYNRNQDGFEAVNAFYHLDKSMRYINETLGITCRPSLNSGIFYYDPSGLSGADNSHYIPSTERIAFGEGGVDDAEDADVILHEFGHGIHDWLTNGSASDYFGEGNGDYWAMSYSRSLNQWASSQAAIHYVFSWDGHNTFWSGRMDNTTKLYPTDLDGEVHDDGEIWCAALMQIFDVIGREKMDKAFLEGISMTTTSSNQQDAAIAVRQAAIDMNYPCADIKVMTDKFTLRGYVMPALPLTINCPGTQTVSADPNNVYTIPSYLTLANAISANCDATLTQSPTTGTVVTPGTYPVTMTATSGTTASCTFNLVVTPYLGVNENNKSKAVIFPNPTNNQITIKGEFDNNESITIYNMLGQKVIEKQIISNEERVDVSRLSNGVYFIYFNIAKATSKFIKE